MLSMHVQTTPTAGKVLLVGKVVIGEVSIIASRKNKKDFFLNTEDPSYNVISTHVF